MSDQHRVTACTVVARNYLPAARVLATSYLKHHPGHGFVIAVIDAAWNEADDTNDWKIVGPGTTGIDQDDYFRMATAYSVTELATAVKPYLLRELRKTSDVVMYIDPDIEVFAPMPELEELATAHGIVLTPHFLQPLPRDGKEPSEAAIMGSGIFNLGFVATGPGSEAFLDFWAERLRHDAIVAPHRQLFTDQRWVDQVPALFPNTVLRDPGFNVAYWNVHERPVREEDGTFTAGGKPLRFFHYSGYRPERPWILTSHAPFRPRVLLSEHPVVRQLCDSYGAKLKANGYAQTLESIPYGFAKAADGTKITPAMRTLFRDAWVKAERKKKDPPSHAFDAEHHAALKEWLTALPENAPKDSGLNRLALAVWESRADLQMAFPHPHGADAEGFRSWCRTSGIREEALPVWALPTEPRELTEPEDEFGVNVVGYLTAELGVGEMARIVHDAIDESGVPVVSVVEDELVSNRRGLDQPDTVGEPRFPVSLLCVNADQTKVVLRHRPQVGHDRYRIGLWAWELEDFPEHMHAAFREVDEVWTVSDFCREALAKHSPVPVKTIPVPVRDPGEPDRRPSAKQVRFLFAFDFASIGERKNPWGVVEAFQRAFEGRDDVRLVLKAINGAKHPHTAEKLRVRITDDDRIELIERYLTVSELDDLYATSTAYVSLHRSEGFGLTVAEAMARALPVISTDYSSTTEFLDESSGWPVPYELVPVGKGNYPYPEDSLWAEPDLDAAAAAMREVADNPAEAARRGRAARAHVLRTRSMRTAAKWVREQLEAAYQSWKSPHVTASGQQVDDPLRPLRDSRQALLWRAEANTASRIPLAPVLRRAVLRSIDHYDVHQRKVLGAVVDGVEGTLGAMMARLEAVERNTERLTIVEHEVSEIADQGRELGQDLVRIDKTLADLAEDRERDREEQLASALDERLTKLWERLEASDRKTFEMFAARDRRLDDDEMRFAHVVEDVAAVYQVQRLRHAPVPTDADVVVCDAGTLIMPKDGVVLPWLAHHRSWEPGEADLMAELVGDGTFLDIGAHVGYHTLRLLQRTSGMAGAVAVEASPANVEYLRRNLSVNIGDKAPVTVLPMAAWDTDGEIRLVQEEQDNSGDYRAHDASDTTAGGVVIPAVRLDGRDEVTAHRISLVKIDLQGRDHRALNGLTAVLERDRPHVVCEFDPRAIEELGDDPAEVLAGYRKLGYDPAPVRENGTAGGDHTDADLIDEARNSESGFATLWLRPSSPGQS
ncbi:FkbM family methyltransferase [Lentzea rhizosphaerae]|uniref:FkbM family methyltransferase n=1 Tax=Lentzea rhizosphaerae TaxID=2041025 RepID=A0ABV8BSR4_9PSEU